MPRSEDPGGESRQHQMVYGASRPYRAAEHRRRLIGRTRAISFGIAASATGASAILGAAFAGAIPGHARPASTPTVTPSRASGTAQAPGAGSAPTPGTGAPKTPGGQAAGTSQAGQGGTSSGQGSTSSGQGGTSSGQGLSAPAQPPYSPPPAPPVSSSGGS